MAQNSAMSRDEVYVVVLAGGASWQMQVTRTTGQDCLTLGQLANEVCSVVPSDGRPLNALITRSEFEGFVKTDNRLTLRNLAAATSVTFTVTETNGTTRSHTLPANSALSMTGRFSRVTSPGLDYTGPFLIGADYEAVRDGVNPTYVYRTY